MAPEHVRQGGARDARHGTKRGAGFICAACELASRRRLFFIVCAGALAARIHAKLQRKNYTGTDNGVASGVRERIRESIVVIVLLNSQTLESARCCEEWECARELGVPIQVVLDLERCTRRVVLEKYRRRFPHLFE